MKRILFSPLGDTDPVRNFHDGSCLHIIRHYKPEKVLLFYTKEMEEHSQADVIAERQKRPEERTMPVVKNKNLQVDRYVKAILRLAPDIEIEQEFSHIDKPHIYDNFIEYFPKLVGNLHKLYPKAEILLNMSSGTPQMKTMLAMIALEEKPWCKGIQVTSPARGSNRNSHAAAAGDIDALLELNEDNDAGAPNRCMEPPLRVFRINNEMQRLTSLLNNYEYKSALTLLQGSVLKNKRAELLLKHADARRDFRIQDAMEGEGIKYFHFQQNITYPTKATELTEYFLQIMLEQKKGNLSGVLLKSVPFLYRLLLEYVKENPAVSLRAFCDKRTGQQADAYRINADTMRKKFPKLANLFAANCKYFNGVDLSFFHLQLICRYLQEEGLAADNEKNDALLTEIDKIQEYRGLRNNIAHDLSYVDEVKFMQKIHLTSAEFVDCLSRILQLLYGKEKIENLKGTYDWLNIRILEELKKRAE